MRGPSVYRSAGRSVIAVRTETAGISMPPIPIERMKGSGRTMRLSSPIATVVPETITERPACFIVWTTAVANVVNGVLNYAWIYGELGFPALGVFGSAQATTVSRLFMAALLVALGWRHLRIYLRSVAPDLLAIRPLVRMLRLGSPMR